ncbi:MAG: SPFH domain-containing protein [candidate division WOR-3 bacterium]
MARTMVTVRVILFLLAVIFIAVPFVLAEPSIGAIAAGMFLGIVLFLAAVLVHVVPPNHIAVIRDPLQRVAGYCEAGIVFMVPFFQRLAEQFDLGWRAVELVQEPFLAQDRLRVWVNLKIYYVLDPRTMCPAWMQMLVDRLGTDDAKWQGYLAGLIRSELNTLILQFPHQRLTTYEGQQDLLKQLMDRLTQVTQGQGVSMERALLYAIQLPEAVQRTYELDFQRECTARRLPEFVEMTASALSRHSQEPLRHLTDLGMLDALLNRDVASLHLGAGGWWFGRGNDGGDGGTAQRRAGWPPEDTQPAQMKQQ